MPPIRDALARTSAITEIGHPDEQLAPKSNSGSRPKAKKKIPPKRGLSLVKVIRTPYDAVSLRIHRRKPVIHGAYAAAMQSIFRTATLSLDDSLARAAGGILNGVAAIRPFLTSPLER